LLVIQCKPHSFNLLTALIYILLAMIRLPLFLSLVYPATKAVAQFNASSLMKYPNVLSLTFPFNPVKAAYWTALPHHRRTPFAVGVFLLCN
jgi:hypothetical protein